MYNALKVFVCVVYSELISLPHKSGQRAAVCHSVFELGCIFADKFGLLCPKYTREKRCVY